MKDKYITWLLLILLAINIIISGCIVRELRRVQEELTEPDKIADGICSTVSLRRIPQKETEEPEDTLTYLGTFRATAYCGCQKCNGKWTGCPTASGTELVEGRTIASDWDVLPAGTEVYIDGIGRRICEDTGTGIDGRRIDIYFDSHEAALAFGVQEVDVWETGDEKKDENI